MRAMTCATAAASVLLLTGCGSDDGPAARDATSQVATTAFQTVSVADIAPRAEAAEVLLVDVREQHEWDAGHSPYAIHVPLGTVGARLAELNEQAEGRPIAFICRSGNRSGQASQTAVEAGLTDIINVDGGMNAWTAAGLPVAS